MYQVRCFFIRSVPDLYILAFYFLKSISVFHFQGNFNFHTKKILPTNHRNNTKFDQSPNAKYPNFQDTTSLRSSSIHSRNFNMQPVTIYFLPLNLPNSPQTSPAHLNPYFPNIKPCLSLSRPSNFT